MGKFTFIDPDCDKCNLCKHRSKVVGGRGNPQARIMVVAEAPGENEDELGIPLIGLSGKMLEQCLLSIGLKSQDCYITNVCKCRPLNNRKPTKPEIKACRPYLYREILEVKPDYVISLGATAYYALTGEDKPLKYIVGKFVPVTLYYIGINFDFQLLSLYHPSYLLRINGRDVGSPKWQTWQSLIQLKEKLDLCKP